MEKLSMLKLIERVPDEASAYKFLEEMRWGDKPVCPHCGNAEKCWFLKPKNGSTRVTRTGSDTARRVWRCGSCKRQFSALTGTVMHGSKIPVRTWVLVFFEMCSNKNGIAAREIERRYDLSAKAAWFLTQRIREAMKRDPFAGMLRGVVVADETYIGGKPGNRHKAKRPEMRLNGQWSGKTPIVSLIDTATGEVRSQVVPRVNRETLEQVIREHVDMAVTTLHTDENRSYRPIGAQMARHQTVNHAWGEYVRDGASTNMLEGYFSQLKRSVDGTHHHVSVEHLPRYLAEFDFRYSTRKDSDTERMRKLVGKVGGRRLTYKPIINGTNA